MATRNSDYQWIVAELVMGRDSKGSPKRQVRPTPGQEHSTSLSLIRFGGRFNYAA